MTLEVSAAASLNTESSDWSTGPNNTNNRSDTNANWIATEAGMDDNTTVDEITEGLTPLQTEQISANKTPLRSPGSDGAAPQESKGGAESFLGHSSEDDDAPQRSDTSGYDMSCEAPGKTSHFDGEKCGCNKDSNIMRGVDDCAWTLEVDGDSGSGDASRKCDLDDAANDYHPDDDDVVGVYDADKAMNNNNDRCSERDFGCKDRLLTDIGRQRGCDSIESRMEKKEVEMADDDVADDGFILRSSMAGGDFDTKPLKREMDAELGDGVGKDALRFGFCGWTPECLQRFNRPSWLLVVMCAVVLFQGMIISGLIGSSATSIERRFQLRSQDYGVIVSIYEATTIVFIVFVTFAGGRGHKPRWLSIGCLLVGLGSLLFALPHFTTEPYGGGFAHGTDNPGICDRGADRDDITTREDCPDDRLSNGGGSQHVLPRYVYVFGAAMVLLALGSLPVYTLGIAVLDESVTVRKSSIYLGILYALSSIGPALGYVIAGVCLTVFTDIQLPHGSSLSEDDPGWVGAWWIGFVLAGGFMLVFAFPMWGFPRELPTTAKIRAEKKCQAHANSGSEITAQPGFGSKPSDLPRAIRYLVINPTFMCTTLAGCSDMLLITAFGVFLPKFIENQFSTTATVATSIIGLCIVPGGAGGSFLGGWLARRLQLGVKGLLKLCVLTTLVTVLALPSFFLQCPQSALAGITADYTGKTSTSGSRADVGILNTCNADCGCSTSQYIPVCVEELGLEYFSPCHAGCTAKDFDNETSSYINCACVERVTNGTTSTVKSGNCDRNCVALPVFVCLLVFILVVLFMSMVPALNVTLRCVPESQKSMALGVQSVISRCLGSIPGPILFGIIIDSTCLQWQQTCDGSGSCWLYRNESLAWRLVVFSCVLKILSGVMFFMAWFTYRPISDELTEAHEAEEQKHEMIKNSERN